MTTLDDLSRALRPGLHPEVAAGIECIRALLTIEVARMRAGGVPAGEDDYRGLYISDSDVERALAPNGTYISPEHLTALAAIGQLRSEGEGPLAHLAQIAGLSAFETGVVLLCLASEASLDLERVVAFAQDDVTKRRPRVDLALRLLAPPGQRDDLRGSFHRSAPLLRGLLVTLHDEPGQVSTPLLARYLAIDPRVAGFLLGDTGIDEQLMAHATFVAEPGALRLPALPQKLAEQLEALAALPVSTLEPPVLGLSGPDEAQRMAVAGRLAACSALPLLRIDAAGLCTALGEEAAFTRAFREAAFRGAALFLDSTEQLQPAERARLRTLVQGPTPAPLVLLGSATTPQVPGLNVDLTEPDFDARRSLWAEQLAADSGLSDADLDSLAGKFRLPVDAVRDAVVSARGLARWRNPAAPSLQVTDLYAAARTRSTPILNDLARKITPHYRWDDIVLPEDAKEQLHEMCAFVEHRHQVYDLWGFERKLAMGKGLMALFAGNSGTGKTMAADVIANTLALDLYKIDLSTVVSKYLGETEKNLRTIFLEAESSNAILFFDEADALFGKRSEVKDAHDRYANIETAYLLQKMEEYSGAVILATNLKMNLDDAFLRRLHFVIDFEMPDEAQRLRIWTSTLPPEMPLGPDVDLGFLARQFRLAGGNIRNIALAAAFLAADDRTAVGMSHFIRATRREYQKLGKMVTDADFGPYRSLLDAKPAASGEISPPSGV